MQKLSLKKLLFFVTMAVGIGFIGATLYLIDLHSLKVSLSQASYTWFAVAIAINGLCAYLRAVRWRVFFSEKIYAVSTLFESISISALINGISPLRIGELSKVAYLSWIKKSRSGFIVKSMIWDRFFDMLFLLLIVAGVLVFRPFQIPPWLVSVVKNLAVVIGGLIVVLFLIGTLSEPISRAIGATSYLSEKSKVFLKKYVDQFSTHTTLQKKLLSLFWGFSSSLLVWVLEISIIYALAEAVHVKLGAAACIMLLVILTGATLTPSAPAYIGVVQFGSVLGFAIIGLPKVEAIAFSILYQFLAYLPSSPLALWFLVRRGLSISTLNRLSQEEEKA